MAELIPMIVDRIEDNAPHVRCFDLRARDGELLPPYTAGAHVDLHLGDRLIRSYSLIGPAGDRRSYRIAVKRQENGRGGSVRAHDVLTLGAEVPVSAPRNNFPFQEGDHPSVLIAGGIGITPIFSMMLQAESLGMDWELHYAVPTAGAAALMGEINDFVGQARHGRLTLHCDDVRQLSLDEVIGSAPDNAHLYCCGPEPMLKAFHAAQGSRPASNFHSERFSADVERASDGAFTVTLVRSGVEIYIDQGQTILDALLDHGIDIPHSCCEGFCGTCRATVIEGEPDHRDVILSDQEKAANDQMLVCCSGSRTERLVLDL